MQGGGSGERGGACPTCPMSKRHPGSRKGRDSIWRVNHLRRKPRGWWGQCYCTECSRNRNPGWLRPTYSACGDKARWACVLKAS